MDALFAEAAGRLAEPPHLGRTGLIPGTPELVPHESYRLVYEVVGNSVWISAPVHAMAAFGPQPAGQTSLPPDVHSALVPVLAANWQ